MRAVGREAARALPRHFAWLEEAGIKKDDLQIAWDYSPYLVLLRGAVHTGRNKQHVIGLSQTLWDRTEPTGYAPSLATGDMPGDPTPPHDVLLHVAIGDHLVTPLGAHMIARVVGAQNLAPVNRSV